MSLSAEESNFLRFYFLNLKIASKAVRAYFDSVHPPSGLASELANCSVTLKGLRFITNSQLKILYPSTACTVRSEDFDTTLIVCLLRNMTPCEHAPKTGWDNLPTPGDASTGADLARVKWYRNMLAHHGDGKLSPVDFSQYWTDLESAILRLGGPSLHQESQFTQHIVLDTSLTDMLNTVRSCEKDILNLQMSHEKHTSMINDIQTTLHKQKLIKEKHETEIQLLQDYLQKGETEANKLATNLSDTNRAIANSNEKIEACKKEIEKNEERMKVLQEQSVNKQNHIDKLNVQIDTLHIKYEKQDKLLKEHREQILKHDEQIALNAKDIDDIKKKQHNTDDSSNESIRKRLEDDTKVLIEEDVREGTFVTTKAVKDGLLLLKKSGVLLITGHAGTGKSRISRHICHMYCTEYTSYKCIKLNKLQEWEDMVTREDNVVILLDDIFGETNCIYNRENDIPILDKVHAYVCKDNIKVIITIRDTVKRQCQEVFDSHRLFRFDFVDLSSEKYELCQYEKQRILKIYMKTRRQSDFENSVGFVDHSGITILNWNEFSIITEENPVKGFPLVVYQFVNNEKYFQLGSKFFDRPTEAMLDEINEIRRQGEIHKKFTIQYGVLVFTAINENCINPDDNSNVMKVSEIIDAIYGVIIRIKKIHISDAVNELKGSYLVKIPNQRSYRYHHQTLNESVILSFAQIDDEHLNKIIPLLNWTFFLKMVKSNAYTENEGEVVLRVPFNTYQLLVYRLVDIYIAEFTTDAYHFLNNLFDTEIFKQEDCVVHVLLTYLLDAVEKKDQEYNYIDTMLTPNYRHSCLSFLKKQDVLFADLLVVFATKEEKFETFQFILQRFNQQIRTDNCFTIDIMKAALVNSLYEIFLLEKQVKSVKYVKALLDIIEENNIPVLFDQNIRCRPKDHLQMCYHSDSDTTCVFLSLCIENAYAKFNVTLLEYLLSRYQKIRFNVNLFLEMYFLNCKARWVKSPSLDALKWIIEKFGDQELIDFDLIERFAYTYERFDVLEYLAFKGKTFDAIFYLKRYLCLDNIVSNVDCLQSFEYYDKDMFNYLVSKIDKSSADLTSLVILLLQYHYVPDYIFEFFLPLCLGNDEILLLACKNAHAYAAIRIMRKSKSVDIQAAVLACFSISNHEYTECSPRLIIIQYIFKRFGYEQFDLKDLCQRAYHSKMFTVIEWLVQHIDFNLLNVDFIKNSLIKNGGLDILEYITKMCELSSFEKNKVLRSLKKNLTSDCSNQIYDILGTVFDGTDDKQALEIDEIVLAAYKTNCFKILVWIYKNCNSYVSTNVRKLFMLACEYDRIEIAIWLLKTVKQISFDINEGKLFISAIDKMSKSCVFEQDEDIERVNWVLNHFQIKPLDLKLGLIRSISTTIMTNKPFNKRLWRNQNYRDLMYSIFTKCLYCLSIEDLKEVMNTCLDRKCYVFVHWFLEIDSSFLIDDQILLNKAAADAEFETIKRLSKNFSFLNMTNAMICVCTSHFDDFYRPLDSYIACLNLMWNESNRESIDISRIVSAVCKKEDFSDTVMTWMLLHFPHNQIPINEVFIACCKHCRIFHVKYILYEIDNQELDIEEAFRHACRNSSHCDSWYNHDKDVPVHVVHFLFQRLHDKNYSLSVLLNELLHNNSYDLILYFLKKGYCRNINMKSVMIQACKLGHFKIVQWILANIKYKKLNIRSAFYAACKCKKNKMQCVALIWHYTRDINMLGIDTVLKSINESPHHSIHKYDGLINWIKYIQNNYQRR